MKKYLMLPLFLLLPSLVNAGQINVTWHEPDKYADIEGADESQKRFQSKTFKQFEKYFAKVAKTLPDDVTVNLKVTDLNLAGDVRYNFALHREIRLVTHVYWPMIEFDYDVKVGDKDVQSGTKSLKDMAFMDRSSAFRSSQRPLSYETRMISSWFKRDVTTMLDHWHKDQIAVMAD